MSINETIEMRSKRFGHFPRTFLWRNKRYDVHTVERCWTESEHRHVRRHFFRVRCIEGTFILFEDVARNTWHMASFEQTA